MSELDRMHRAIMDDRRRILALEAEVAARRDERRVAAHARVWGCCQWHDAMAAAELPPAPVPTATPDASAPVAPPVAQERP